MEKHNKTHAKKLVWLVGGGTGGHIIALLAVAQVLKRANGIRLCYIGDKNGPEYTLARQAGLPFFAVPTGKLRRYLSFSAFFLNIRDTARIMRGVFVSYRAMRRFKPAVILSKGGPVALPVALAAWLTNTPLLTHESDAIMGLTNRLIARFARVVFTGFPATTYPSSYAQKIISVGIPLRQEFCQPVSHNKHKKRAMILVTGGSQGALAINQAIEAILPQLLETASVMHITGAYSYEQYKQVKDNLPRHLADYYGVIDFTPQIVDYMREADVVVSRASSTIFELATLGAPMILIPLPGSANDHQRKNAEIFSEHHAALMLLQENLTPQHLYETIMSVLSDQKLQAELREGMRGFACCNAAKRVAAVLKEYVEVVP